MKQIVQTEWQMKSIKYFEPGHTFMPADNFHHVIEQGMRKKQRIEDFQDFADLVSFSWFSANPTWCVSS